MKLKFSVSKLQFWSKKYSYDKPDLEKKIVEVIAPIVKRSGFLEKDDFLQVCNWKTTRSKPRCAQNEESYVKEITYFISFTRINTP